MENKCPKVTILRQYALEELDEDDSKEIEQHINDCRECKLLADSIREFNEHLGTITLIDLQNNDTLAIESVEQNSRFEGGNATEVSTDTVENSPRASVNFRFDNLPELKGFKLIGLLGEGASSRVYLAIETLLKRKVVIKLFKPNIKPHDLLKEACVAASLEHENIVKIYHVNEVPPFITMPFTRGTTLQSLIQKTSHFSIDRTIAITSQIALGLDEAHRKGVIHQDIKPANIWIEKDGTCKILDFGVALTDETDEKSISGTPGYFSPEQALGSQATKASDLYSLGRILYQLTIHCQRTSETKYQILALENLIEKLTAEDPKQRPESARIVYDSLCSINKYHESKFAISKILALGIGLLLSVCLLFWFMPNEPEQPPFDPNLALREIPSELFLPHWQETKPVIYPLTEPKIQELQASWSKHLNQPITFSNQAEIKFQLIPPGDFVLGLPPEDLKTLFTEKERPKRGDQSNAIRVRISDAYYLSACEITQKQFNEIMGMNEQPDSHLPVVNISIDEAIEFCERLSEKDGGKYRLPTEAEWEFACRSGTYTAYCFGNDREELMKYAWYNKKHPQEVGLLKPNALGLYDMHGNVWEFCSDFRDSSFNAKFQQELVIDPQGPPSGVEYMIKGGCFDNRDFVLSSGIQGGNKSLTNKENKYGFRVLLEIPMN